MEKPESLIALLPKPRGEIIRLLRRRPHTASELATTLNRTGNAVRVQLAKLESEGLVRRSGKRAGFRKPEYVFELTADADGLFYRAYGPLVRQLLGVLGEQMSEQNLVEALNVVAIRLAISFGPATKRRSRTEQAASAANLVVELGGAADVEKRDHEIVVRGWSCPFSEVSPWHPELCRMVATLLSESTGLTLEEQCDRTPGTPKCAFRATS